MVIQASRTQAEQKRRQQAESASTVTAGSSRQKSRQVTQCRRQTQAGAAAGRIQAQASAVVAGRHPSRQAGSAQAGR